MAKTGIICQACGVEAPTRYVEFYQNIGALIMRFRSHAKGQMCKRCVHTHFWKMTSITTAVGWLGTISVILAPCFVLNNLFRYLGALGMPKVPKGAKPPVVDPATAQRLAPHFGPIVQRVNAGEDLVSVAQQLAPTIGGVTPGQIVRYVIAVAQHQRAQAAANPPTGGFPVIPLPPQPQAPLPAIPVAE
jgi:hypothetical protein